MINVLHRVTQINLDVDATNFNGNAAHDNALTDLTKLKAGKMVGINTSGKVALADNKNVLPIGFVVEDASANPFDNYPTVASKKLAVTLGDCFIETDQLVTGITFAAQDKVYVSATAGSEGLLTNVQPSWTVGSDTVKADPIGIAANATSSQVKTLKVIRMAC